MTIDRDAIRRVYEIIAPYIRKTPVLNFNEVVTDTPVVLKLELFQHSGSFKARGAFTNLLLREVPAAGVAAASGGNHGAAVAYAAMKLRKPAKIFIPTVASPAKLNRIRSYGADVVVVGDRYADSLLECEKWIEESAALSIHAYNQLETLCGQGTVGLELQEQAPQLDTLLVAVGGGGLIGGIASWYSGEIKIIGVEPEAAPTLTYALRAGKPVDAPAGGIAADSLAPKRVGEIMLPIAQRFVNRVVLVSDDSIVNAQKFLWERARLVTEPGGAAAFAALLSGQYKPEPGERVGVIICGANTEAVSF